MNMIIYLKMPRILTQEWCEENNCVDKQVEDEIE